MNAFVENCIANFRIVRSWTWALSKIPKIEKEQENHLEEEMLFIPMNHYKPKTTLKKKLHHIYSLETVKHRFEFPLKDQENHKNAAVGYKDHHTRNHP